MNPPTPSLLIPAENESDDGEFSSASFEILEEEDDQVDSLEGEPQLKMNAHLLKLLSDPNPLMKPQQRGEYYIRNVVNQTFSDLPEFFDEVREKEENYGDEIDSEFLDYGQCLENLQDNFQANDALNEEEKPLKSLFRFHHDDPNAKLVYKRYYDLFPSKYYASYICDLKTALKQANSSDLTFKKLNNNQQAIKEKSIILSPDDLSFDSKFESGNLFQAWKKGNKDEYNLILQNDINSKGNTQWFFFSVQHARKGQSVVFNIINLNKKTSLFQKGMLPCVYSTKRKELKGMGWKREGYSIKYFKSFIQKEGFPSRSYYTLSFTYTFQYNDDKVFFSYCYPYTYSHLNHFLKSIEDDPARAQFIHRKVACKTLARNNMDVITITASSQTKREARKLVYLFGRQHPGEVTSSYMIEGAIKFLTENSQEAEILRQHFIFKIVPMINVDGVIHGNNRCSLAGVDLNRRWKNPHKKLHPCISFIKNMIKKNSLSREAKLLVDFHGHSKKLNAFFYGNSYCTQPELTRIFPLLVSKQEKRISFDYCRFRVQKYYEQTARIALWRTLRIPHVFTLEASFYGYYSDGGRHKIFTPKSYLEIGRSVCIGLYQMLCDEIKIHPDLLLLHENEDESVAALKRGQKIQRNTQEGECLLGSVICDLQEQRRLIEVGDGNYSGSDSSCSEDDFDEEMFAKILPKQITKSNKSKTNKNKRNCNSSDTKNEQESGDNDNIEQGEKSSFSSKRDTLATADCKERKKLSSSFRNNSRKRRSSGATTSTLSTDKSVQTDEIFFQNSFNFLKKSNAASIEKKGKQQQDKQYNSQNVNQLPPRPYFIKNSNGYAQAMGNMLQDQLNSSRNNKLEEDQQQFIQKLEDTKSTNNSQNLRHFCIQGYKVKEDQTSLNVKQYEYFRSSISNCRDVMTQTPSDMLFVPKSPLYKIHEVTSKRGDEEIQNIFQNEMPIIQQPQLPQQQLQQGHFQRKRNISFNGPTLNQLLLYTPEESCQRELSVNQHNRISKNYSSQNRKRDSSRDSVNFTQHSVNNSTEPSLPFNVIRQEFLKVQNSQNNIHSYNQNVNNSFTASTNISSQIQGDSSMKKNEQIFKRINALNQQDNSIFDNLNRKIIQQQQQQYLQQQQSQQQQQLQTSLQKFVPNQQYSSKPSPLPYQQRPNTNNRSFRQKNQSVNENSLSKTGGIKGKGQVSLNRHSLEINQEEQQNKNENVSLQQDFKYNQIQNSPYRFDNPTQNQNGKDYNYSSHSQNFIQSQNSQQARSYIIKHRKPLSSIPLNFC